MHRESREERLCRAKPRACHRSLAPYVFQGMDVSTMGKMHIENLAGRQFCSLEYVQKVIDLYLQGLRGFPHVSRTQCAGQPRIPFFSVNLAQAQVETLDKTSSFSVVFASYHLGRTLLHDGEIMSKTRLRRQKPRLECLFIIIIIFTSVFEGLLVTVAR